MSSSSTQRHLHIILLVVLTSTQITFPEGRTTPELLQSAEGGRGGVGAEVVVRALIGSRPPRCQDKCISCGHCEAVQVPVVPQKKKNGVLKNFHLGIYFRSDEDNTNYKPLSWKCKCGDRIINP